MQSMALIGLMLLANSLASAQVQPNHVLTLNPKAAPFSLSAKAQYWIAADRTDTVAEMAHDTSRVWRPTDSGAIYPINAGQAVWVRMTLPPSGEGEHWYLEVPYAAIDSATLYSQTPTGLWSEQHAGDLTPVADWPVPHRHPLLPLAVSTQSPTRYLLKLENEHPFSAPLQLISEGRLSHSEQQVSLVLGIFFGLVGFAALISSLAAMVLRDSAYGFYALYVTAMGLTQATITGIAGLHLWPHWAWWNDVSSTVFPTFTAAVTLFFACTVVALPERSRSLNRAMTALGLAGMAAAVGLMLVPAHARLTLVVPAVLALELGSVFVVSWAWRRGDRFAPWVLLSYVPVLVAAGFALAGASGWMAKSALTQNGMQIAMVLNLPIIMVVLMLRSQQRFENIRRILGLNRIDPNTGLINNHVFSERLMRMIARSDRLRHRSAVMLIDVINTEQVQRDYGRKAAEELPLRVAQRLLSTAREIDSTARLSGHRFGMLMEGPFTAEEAATLGPRIVARCLMPYKGMPPDCVAQVHVVYALVPDPRISADDLRMQLEDRLATIPALSRRKVFVLGDALSPTFARRSQPPKVA